MSGIFASQNGGGSGGAPLERLIVEGAAPGDIAVAGITATDTLTAVIDYVFDSGTLVDVIDLTSEFTISADGTINNDGGTDTSSSKLLVMWNGAIGNGTTINGITGAVTLVDGAGITTVTDGGEGTITISAAGGSGDSIKGTTPTTDVAPGAASAAGGNAYPKATEDNLVGAPLYLNGGIGSRYLTVLDYTALTGKTITLTINGTGTTYTEGVEWNAATSNEATATSIASAIGVTAEAQGATIYITPAAGVRTLMISSDDIGDGIDIYNQPDGAVVLNGDALFLANLQSEPVQTGTTTFIDPNNVYSIALRRTNGGGEINAIVQNILVQTNAIVTAGDGTENYMYSSNGASYYQTGVIYLANRVHVDDYVTIGHNYINAGSDVITNITLREPGDTLSLKRKMLDQNGSWEVDFENTTPGVVTVIPGATITPTWRKVATLTHADIAAGTLSGGDFVSTFVAWGLQSGWYSGNVMIDVTVPFTGGTISSGEFDASNLNPTFLTNVDIFTSNKKMGDPGAFLFNADPGTVDLSVTATLVGDTWPNCTAGSLDIWVLLSAVPA